MKTNIKTIHKKLFLITIICLTLYIGLPAHQAFGQTFTITASSSGPGYITPTGSIVVKSGATALFVMLPQIDVSKIFDVTVDGSSVGPRSSYIFDTVKANHTISVTFIKLDAKEKDDDGDGYSEVEGDCDDTNKDVHPAAVEIPNDGIDNDCVGGDQTNEVFSGCIEISDVPLETVSNSDPSNVMFVLDDSGSMDWTFMTDEEDGLYVRPKIKAIEAIDKAEQLLRDSSDSFAGVFGGIPLIGPLIESAISGALNLLIDGMVTLIFDPVKDFIRSLYTFNYVFDVVGNVYSEGLWDAIFGVCEDLTDCISINLEDCNLLCDCGTCDECNYNCKWWDLVCDAKKIACEIAKAACEVIKFACEQKCKIDREVCKARNWFKEQKLEVCKCFHNMLCTKYTMTRDCTILWTIHVPGERRYWRSQWCGYNRVYYDPSVVYDPWPNKPNSPTRYAPSDISDPGKTLDLDAQYYDVHESTVFGNKFTIRNRHWYMLGKDDYFYLVTLDSSGHHFYRISHKSDYDKVLEVKYGHVKNEFTSYDPRPANQIRSKHEDIQNFANWYTYYRKRAHSARAAISHSIHDITGTNIGILTINDIPGRIKSPVVSMDSTSAKTNLLNQLYNYRFNSLGTPLRPALYEVGKYYNTKETNSVLGTSPFSLDEGGRCQQAFAVLLTDGFWNSGFNKVGDVDLDGAANTLADIALKYYQTDLAPDLDDMVPPSKYDKIFDPNKVFMHQHMSTYTVSFGIGGTPGYDVINYPACPETCPVWKSPFSGSAAERDQRRVDDLWHAAVNGRGAYLNAQNSKQLIYSLKRIMWDIRQQMGSAAPVAVIKQEGSTLSEDEYYLFLTSYDSSEGWSGDIRAMLIDLNEVTKESYSPSVSWSGKAHLDQPSITDATRQIITFNGSTGVPFQPSSFTTEMKAKWNNPGNLDDLIKYIRGDRTNEEFKGGTFRARVSRLGDIVHSGGTYINGCAFVGSNDGMMHAFDAETGYEIFAYIPGKVFKNLIDLTKPEYTHKFFVDQTPTAVKLDSASIIVGGLGKGGKGYYCLDVSAPSSINEANASSLVKWEFPSGTDNDMGYSFSTPAIVKTTAGRSIIFGNGYESTNGKAVLYILVINESGSINQIKKIDTNVGPCNGLSTPAFFDEDDDGIVDFAYAGDLLGNLWKFNLRDNISKWDVAYKTNPDGSGTSQPLFTARYNTNPQPITSKPAIIRHCGDSKGYIIVFGTGQYLTINDLSNSETQTVYGIWDWQNDWEEKNKIAPCNANSPYNKYFGHLLPKKASDPAHIRRLSNFTNYTLLLQTFITSGSFDQSQYKVLSDNEIKWCLPINAPTETLCNLGWYVNLDSKERIHQDLTLSGDRAILVSKIPQSEEKCKSSESSVLYSLNACNGGRLLHPDFDISGKDDVPDNKLDDFDKVKIGPDDDDIAPPSGIVSDVALSPPTIVTRASDGEEIKIMSTSTGSIKAVVEKSEKPGILYWKYIKE